MRTRIRKETGATVIVKSVLEDAKRRQHSRRDPSKAENDVGSKSMGRATAFKKKSLVKDSE